MGRWAVRTAAGFTGIARIVIADIDLERAEAVADEVGSPAVARQVDVTDEVALAQALAEADIVLNTMGPFAQFATPILRAALNAGCHYLDIDDDWESTLEAFELDDMAKEAGVSAVIGLGASPGVSNYLAVAACAPLDSVESLLTGWKLKGAETESDGTAVSAGPSAAFAHWLAQSSGTIRTWSGGRLQEAAPLQPIAVDYPGIGQQVVFTCGHPEPITLGPNLSVQDTVSNVMSGPSEVFETLGSIAREFASGEITLGQAEQNMSMLRSNSVGEKQDPSRRSDPMPGLWALAQGVKDGHPTRVSAHLERYTPGKMGGATGIPLAVGLDMLISGRVLSTGVLAPEQAFDASDFLARYGDFLESARSDSPDFLTIREVKIVS